MDVFFNLGDLKFVWDSEKAEKNFKKHKVYFETAAKVFLDDYRIDNYDENHSNFEDRNIVIGRVEKILVVIYTERGENYRIISARHATKVEEEEYYEQFAYV